MNYNTECKEQDLKNINRIFTERITMKEIIFLIGKIPGESIHQFEAALLKADYDDRKDKNQLKQHEK